MNLDHIHKKFHEKGLTASIDLEENSCLFSFDGTFNDTEVYISFKEDNVTITMIEININSDSEKIVLEDEDLNLFDFVFGIITNPYEIIDFKSLQYYYIMLLHNDIKQYLPTIKKYNLVIDQGFEYCDDVFSDYCVTFSSPDTGNNIIRFVLKSLSWRKDIIFLNENLFWGDSDKKTNFNIDELSVTKFDKILKKNIKSDTVLKEIKKANINASR